MSEKHRVDVWLKRACLFKQRSDASDACKGGHVKLNGQRCKPSAEVKVEDVIEVVGDERLRRFVVLGLPERSISREAAREMYRDESPPPPARVREERVAERESGAGRPTKRDRREMERWRR